MFSLLSLGTVPIFWQNDALDRTPPRCLSRPLRVAQLLDHEPAAKDPPTMPRAFRPGDHVIWWKTAGPSFAVPVGATVVAVTAQRVTIEADDSYERGVGLVRRSVDPARLQLAEGSAGGEADGGEVLARRGG